jgi:hypothetical protein
MTPFLFRLQIVTVIMLAMVFGATIVENHLIFAGLSALLMFLVLFNLMADINRLIIASKQ